MTHKERQELVARLRAVIADARTLRGLPPAAPIDSLDDALRRAQELRVRHTIEPPSAPYPIRRRMLLGRIRHAARCYALMGVVDDYVAASGTSALEALDADALDALASWLERIIDDMQTGCDSRYAPPAS